MLSGSGAKGSAHGPAPPLRRYFVQPESPERRAWQRMLGSLAMLLGSGGIQTSAVRAPRALASAGPVELRLRVSRANFRPYGGIYLRDGYRCRSPVCSRRDVTPHHLRFRSRGGGDEPDNLATVCSWCHLFGIHGGRIRAEGTARRIRWELGPTGEPCVVVDGRDRIAA